MLMCLMLAQAASAQVTSPFGTPGSYDLVTNSNLKVGEVTVSNDQVYLSVEVTMSGAWEIRKAAAHAAPHTSGFPRSRSGRAQTSRFDFQFKSNQGATSFTYTETLANLGHNPNVSDMLVSVAAKVQRSVVRGNGNPNANNGNGKGRVQRAVAWIDGSNFCRNGGSYATYSIQRENLSGRFTTYTASDWSMGSDARNIGGYLDANFGICFPDGLTVGYPQRVNGYNGCAATFTSACGVRGVLPTTGQPCPLRGRYTNPTGGSGSGGEAGQLLGQVLSLALNVGFDDCNESFNWGCVPLRNLCIVDNSSPLKGKTVGWVLDEANWRLSGLGGVTSNPDADHQLNVSYGLISSTVAAINANFENAGNNGFLGVCFQQGDFVSRTQSEWRTFNDVNDIYSLAFGTPGMKVGDSRQIGNLQGCSARFTSLYNLQCILPRTGQPCPLTGAYVDPTGGVNQGREAGQLLGTVSALMLNVAFDLVSKDFNPHCISFGDLVVVDPNSPVYGKSVFWVLDEANWHLSGLGTVTQNPDPGHDISLTFAQINNIVRLINCNFPNGQDCRYLGVALGNGDYQTYTQGDANNPGWAEQSNGTNLGSYRDAKFCCAFPDQAVVGDARRIGNLQGCSARFTSGYAAAIALANAKGQPCPLTGAYTNPDARTEAQEAGVLLAEVLALAMNIAYDKCDANFGADAMELADLIVDDANSPAYGKSLAWVLDEANWRLSGLGQYVQNPDAGHNQSFTFQEISDLCAQINANFRNGTTDNGLLRRP